MKFDLIISDYDGTLAESGGKTIPIETIKAIKEYEKKGGKFVICTGRSFRSIKKIADECSITGICVTMQGAVVTDLETEKPLYQKGLLIEKAVEVIKEANRKKLEFVVYISGEMYYENDGYFAELYQSLVKIKAVKVDNIIDFILKTNLPVSKISLLGEPEKMPKVIKDFNDSFKGDGVIFNSGGKILCEAVNPDFVKGEAVKFLAKHFSVPYSKIMTIGDSTNDITLVKGEWHGVCVGDGADELKKEAKEITVPLKDNPVKYLIEKYCL